MLFLFLSSIFRVASEKVLCALCVGAFSAMLVSRLSCLPQCLLSRSVFFHCQVAIAPRYLAPGSITAVGVARSPQRREKRREETDRQTASEKREEMGKGGKASGTGLATSRSSSLFDGIFFSFPSFPSFLSLFLHLWDCKPRMTASCPVHYI